MFRYISDSNGAVGTLHEFMALGGRQAQCGTFQASTAGGTQAITGVGFQPDCVIIMGTATTSLQVAKEPAEMNIGFAIPGVTQCAAGSADPNVVAGFGGNPTSDWTTSSVVAMPFMSVTLRAVADLASFDSDGFTLNWTTTPATAWDLMYIAFKGGNYGIGTGTARTTTGTQAISGLGFAPTGVMILGTKKTSLGNAVDTHWSVGFASASGQYNSVGANTSGDIRSSAIQYSGEAITIIQDANAGGGGGFSVLAQADVSSFDSDGFTLDWTTVSGSAYDYFWLAFDGQVEVGRFSFKDAAQLISASHYEVPTAIRPVALLGHTLDVTADNSLQFGDSLGFSMCGSDFTQYGVSYQVVNAPPFSLSQSRSGVQSRMFGCYAHQTGANPSGFAVANCTVYEFGGGQMGQIMRHRRMAA